MIHPDFPPWAQHLASWSFGIIDDALKAPVFGFSVLGGWNEDELPYIDTKDDGVDAMIYPTFLSDAIWLITLYRPRRSRLARHIEAHEIDDSRLILDHMRLKWPRWQDVCTAYVACQWLAGPNALAPDSEFNGTFGATARWSGKRFHYRHSPKRWDLLLPNNDGRTPYQNAFLARQARIDAAAAAIQDIGKGKDYA